MHAFTKPHFTNTLLQKVIKIKYAIQICNIVHSVKHHNYLLSKHSGRVEVLLKLFFRCGNKMPTRCNRGFYCRPYCLLNMFRAPLCPSSGAQEYYTVVADCGIWCCGFQVVGLVWSWGLCVRFAGCCSDCLSKMRRLFLSFSVKVQVSDDYVTIGLIIVLCIFILTTLQYFP